MYIRLGLRILKIKYQVMRGRVMVCLKSGARKVASFFWILKGGVKWLVVF